MVRPEGFEPPTYGFEARRSIQLSYGRMATRIDITVAATPGQATVHHNEPSPATQAADSPWRTPTPSNCPDGDMEPRVLSRIEHAPYSPARMVPSFGVL
jgi:hypothetical protein